MAHHIASRYVKWYLRGKGARDIRDLIPVASDNRVLAQPEKKCAISSFYRTWIDVVDKGLFITFVPLVAKLPFY